MRARGLPLALALAGALPAAPAQAAEPLSLARAIGQALAHEARYQAAQASFRGEREVLEQTRARLLPEVSATLSRFQNDLDAEFGPVTQQLRYPSSGSSINLRQPLYRPERWAAYQQARAEVLRLEAVLAAERNRLQLAVATTYLEVLRAAAELRAYEAQKLAVRGQAAAAARAVPLGLGSGSERDERAAQAELAGLRTMQSEAGLMEARRQLENLVGQAVTHLLSAPEDGFDAALVAVADLPHWLERAAQSAPEVRAARAAVAVAGAAVRRAEAGHKPTLDLVAGRSKSRSETFTAINSTYYNSSIGLQLNVPIYAGGRVISEVRQAIARGEQAEAQLQLALREAALVVEREHRIVRQAAQRLRAHAAVIQAARQTVRGAEQGLARGTNSQLEVLDARGKLESAQQEQAAAVSELLAARVRLQGAVGDMAEESVPALERVLVRVVVLAPPGSGETASFGQ